LSQNAHCYAKVLKDAQERYGAMFVRPCLQVG
jgi:hypothetical protein